MIKKLAFISLLLFTVGCGLVEDENPALPPAPSPFADTIAAPAPAAPAPLPPITMNPVSPFMGATPGTITPPAEDKPLMVIRFNQDFVHYDSPLYMAVKKALDAKPNAVFNSVVYYPAGSDADAGAMNRQAAEQEGGKLMASFAKAGVSAPQARISYQPAAIADKEIKIFVE